MKQYTEKFDRVQLDTVCCPINVSLADTCDDLAGALNGLKPPLNLTLVILPFLQDFPDPQLPEETVAAFQTAFDNISSFHHAQQRKPLSVETMPGVTCRRLTRPIGAQALP